MDVVIEGKAYIDGNITKCCLGIEHGKIVSIQKVLRGDKHYDCGDALLFPSALDVHVHFRDPGMTWKEDFFTGSKAAALGGISCVLDMPNTCPSATRKEAVEKKVRIAKRKACVDYGFYGGIGKGSNVEALAKICQAFKIYLCKSNDIFVPVENLRNVLQRVKRTGKILAVHAEHEPCLSPRETHGLVAYEHSRPVQCEVAALRHVLKSNEGIGAPLHICHISSFEGVAMAHARASVGITPHHMLLSTSSVFSVPAMGKVNPPLRSEREREKMWGAVQQGMVSVIESDHAPHLLEEKQDFYRAPPGMPGVDAVLPLFLFMVKKEKIALSAIHSFMCERPARRFSINKGAIMVGRDADILAIDFKERSITPYSQCGWSCYEGLKGVYPRHFWLRGQKIIENGEFIGSAGEGEMIA